MLESLPLLSLDSSGEEMSLSVFASYGLTIKLSRLVGEAYFCRRTLTGMGFAWMLLSKRTLFLEAASLTESCST